MSFILGVLIGVAFSKKGKSNQRGGICLETLGSHATNPFNAPPSTAKMKIDDAPINPKEFPRVITQR